MRKKFIFFLTFILVLNLNLISASDVLVWQGQYYTGTTFNTGTYEFNFSVYDSLTEGDICYSNTTNLTTGNFGEWRTEQNGVNSACNNASKDYFLNINIDGIDQTPRKRILVWRYLRKDINEIITAPLTVTAPLILNTNTALDKLSYAQEFANTTLIEQQDYALSLIITAEEISSFAEGERLELKILRLTTAGELAQNLIEYNKEIATAKILEAKRLALIYINNSDDITTIENTALNQLNTLNQTATQQAILVNNSLNDAIANIAATDNGIRYCFSDGSGCLNNGTKSNLTNYALKNQSEIFAGNITTTQIGFFGWLGSLTSRITKLWAQDINASGDILTTGNIQGNYYSDDGSAGITNTADYHVCTSWNGVSCGSWCALRIKNGLIVGCA